MKINEDYIIYEAMGVLNTPGSTFNKLVERIFKDTIEFPNVGTKIKEEDVEEIKAKHVFDIDINNTRRFTYNNTSLKWLPSLDVVWIKTDKILGFDGYFIQNTNIIVIIIDKYNDMHKNNYKNVISHEIRHKHTEYIEKEYLQHKMSKVWRDKSMSISQIEQVLYNLSRHKNLLSKLKIDLNHVDTPKTLNDSFVFILNNMYYFQLTEMKSFLESLYTKIKEAVEVNPYFIYKQSKEPGSIYYIYDTYYKLYNNLKIILKNIDTKELGTIYSSDQYDMFNSGVLSILSKKLYAQSKNRNVKDDDPTDLKIWIEYKLKQLKQWLYRAKSMIVDGIEKSKNTVFDFQLKIYYYFQEYRFDIKVDSVSVLNFLDIIKAWRKEKNMLYMSCEILYQKRNFEMMCKKQNQYPSAKMFANKIIERGIDDVDKLLKNMKAIINAYEKQIEKKRSK